MTRVLGIEGTAWAASAAIYDDADDSVRIESDPYVPESGGIHPREAAEHMQEAVPGVVRSILASMDGPPDAVAFSRGPGLGPCLRICGTAARSLALTFDVPLVGVNHMVAHAEIGRHRSGFADPICLNASGANAHVLAYRGDRYRVLGETMDTGVGNAIDKFARHLDWGHPGGPKVEQAAGDGTYVDLPYVVKGMDFSFAGLTSAAQDAYDTAVDDGRAARPAPSPAEADGLVADLCFSLQETMFAMLTEVAERALSLTGSDELVLGGGVGQNERLQSMLAEMCEARGARFFAPESRFLRDNAGMIAVLGAKMYEAGDTLDIETSRVRPNFRPDDVPVTWRSPSPVATRPVDTTEVRGAEALVKMEDDVVEKRRQPKPYREAALDDRLRRERTTAEARLLALARQHGVPTPVVLDVDRAEHQLRLERVGASDLDGELTAARVRAVGEHLASLHAAGFVHGDPTTRNVRVGGSWRGGDGSGDRCYLIDFGLGFHTDDVEDFAMDLHVLGQSLGGMVDDPAPLRRALSEAYGAAGDQTVLDRLDEIEGRGRYGGARPT